MENTSQDPTSQDPTSQDSTAIDTATASSATPGNLESVKPYLILTATGKDENEHETENKSVSEKQLLKLNAGTYTLSLWIDYQERCPSDGQILRKTKKRVRKGFNKEELPNVPLSRQFDTEKAAVLDLVFKPEGHPAITQKFKGKASKPHEYPLGVWSLDPGTHEIKLIGSIWFKYLNYIGERIVSEKQDLDLTFWFEVASQPDSSPQEDSDSSSHRGYYTEAELRS